MPLDSVTARAVLREVDDVAVRLNVLPSSYDGPEVSLPIAQRRRRRNAGLGDPVGVASLMVNEDGVLFWHLGDINGVPSGRRRMRRGVPDAPDGEIVELYHFDKLEPNAVNTLLRKHDADLNDHQGLSELTLKKVGAAGQAVQRSALTVPPKGKKKRLLFVHGTFSKTEAFFAGMEAMAGGPAGIKTLFRRYDQVLAFDHPTLSVSPVMNAFDLARLLAGIDGPLDIVAHSRGGLVARWLLDGYGLNGSGPYRAVLVGSPLAGTSLASPPRLRSALSVMSNFGTALKLSGAAAVVYAPFLSVPLALLRIASSVLTLTAKTPIVDAAVTAIAGLHGQSRIADHPELTRLRAVKLVRPPEYFVVRSNFETDDPGWRFWRWFRKDTLRDAGSDLVFPGPNDLVVDTDSMSDIPNVKIAASSVKDFGTTDLVHHTSYFGQPGTLDFILDKLS